ncbi:MAG: M90 family metallopeptidase [Bacteroidota bacterium]
MKKLNAFGPWILLFLVLLSAIPVILHYKGFNIAKILGVMVVIGIVAALWVWRINTRKKAPRNERIQIDTNDKFWLNEKISFYRKLKKDDQKTFRDRLGIFLADVTITEVGKDQPEKSTCLYVASSAVIAFWGLPYWNYADLQEVIVYPSNFDEDNQLNKRGMIGGKVYHGGIMDRTMILSLPELKKGFAIDNDKKNVGVHEFAHLLDKSDGSLDGVPPEMGENDRKIWTKLMDEEMKAIDNDDSTVPDYGATNKVEFFAVITSYYKECPKLLSLKHPELFEVLERYYGSEQASDE